MSRIIENKVIALKQQIQQARDAQTRATIQMERAEHELEQVRRELVVRFGVHDAADAQRVLEELRATLTDVMDRLTATLDQAQQ